MKKYLKVFVLTNDLGDSTANGVTLRFKDKRVIPCDRGNHSEADVIEPGFTVLELEPCAVRGRAPHFVPEGETRWCMFGGNFVYTSDSRFSEQYGDSPIKVHDRIEGK